MKIRKGVMLPLLLCSFLFGSISTCHEFADFLQNGGSKVLNAVGCTEYEMLYPMLSKSDWQSMFRADSETASVYMTWANIKDYATYYGIDKKAAIIELDNDPESGRGSLRLVDENYTILYVYHIHNTNLSREFLESFLRPARSLSYVERVFIYAQAGNYLGNYAGDQSILGVPVFLADLFRQICLWWQFPVLALISPGPYVRIWVGMMLVLLASSAVITWRNLDVP